MDESMEGRENMEDGENMVERRGMESGENKVKKGSRDSCLLVLLLMPLGPFYRCERLLWIQSIWSLQI